MLHSEYVSHVHYTFLVVGYLAYFHFLPIMNMTSINAIEQVSLEFDVESFGHMLRNGIAETYSGIIFSFLRILHTDLHSGWTSLQSHQ